MSRIRHCLECPKCKLRYLISLTPYTNGSYVTSSVNGSCEEYVLFCAYCRLGSRWQTTEVMLCEVSNAAYRRGYGTEDEIWWLRPEPRRTWTLPSLDSNIWPLTARRKNQP